jgi:hypothetical protein
MLPNIPSGNRALSSLRFSGGCYHNGNEWTDDAVTITTAMTEADFSGKHLGSHGPIILAAHLSRDKGAMTSLNLASIKLGIEGAKIIAACLSKCT